MWFSEEARRGIPPASVLLGRLLEGQAIVRVPGVHNALAGLLAKRAGFEALYLSGGALTASNGMPDLGMMTLEELCFFTRSIVRAAGLPLVVDADTGFGGPLNVMRTVRELEDAGAAAIQIEDQVAFKRCGHLADKHLIGPEEMAAKVRAAIRARRHALIVARTDAIAVEGVEGAIARARLYRDTGADVVFPDAPTSEAMFRAFAREVEAPLMANMTEFGRSPALTANQLQEMGFKIVIWPVSAMRVAARAIEGFYKALHESGTAAPWLARMQTREELYDTLDYYSYQALEAATVEDRTAGATAAPMASPENRRGKTERP